MRQRVSRPIEPGLLLVAVGGLAGTLVYCALLLSFPLLSLYLVPLQNLNHMPLGDWPKGLIVVCAICLLFSAYALGARGLADALRSRAGPALLLGFPIAFMAVLLFVQPATSTDLYDYLFRGRMVAHYGANPFVTPPNALSDDPLYRYIAWRHAVTAYGPLWEQLSGAITRLADEGALPLTTALLRLLLSYKLLAALGVLLCGAAIWSALADAPPYYRWLGLYLWLWNPLVLWESVGTGHNDVWVALLTVAAVWSFKPRRGGGEAGRQGDGPAAELASRRAGSLRRALLAFVALTLGGLIKFVTFFFGPILLASSLRTTPTAGSRARLVLLCGTVCGGLVALAYAPFWQGIATLDNVVQRGRLLNATWLAALRMALHDALGDDRAAMVATRGGLVLLGLGVAWASWRAWREPAAVRRHMLWLVLWFLFICNPWFQPWYAIWPLALVAVQPWRGSQVAFVGVFCLTALLNYVVGGLLLPALDVPWDSAQRELLLAIALYGPPLVVLLSFRSGEGTTQAQAVEMVGTDAQAGPGGALARSYTE